MSTKARASFGASRKLKPNDEMIGAKSTHSEVHEKIETKWSTAGSWDGLEPPEWFVCPISMEVMRIPALLLETGQVFEQDALVEWLKLRRTCPTTGVQLTDVGIVPVHGLRRAIQDWSDRVGGLEAIHSRDDAENSASRGQASMKTLGIMYNVGHLCAIVDEHGGKTQDGVRAMGLLNDMLSAEFVGKSVIKGRLPRMSMVDSRVDDLGGMHEAVAELRFRLFGERMKWSEKVLMLGCKGMKLMQMILCWFAGWAKNRRCRLSAAAKVLSGLGNTELGQLRESLVEIACPLRTDLYCEARDGAVLVLSALLMESDTSPRFTTGSVGGALLRYCASNRNAKIQFCAVRGTQKMCATEKGRRIVSALNSLSSIVSLLPPADSPAGYGVRVFSSVFSRITAVESIVKLLHLVVEHPDGADELLQCGAIPALNEVSWSLKLDHEFEKKHLDPLLEKLLQRLAFQRGAHRE